MLSRTISDHTTYDDISAWLRSGDAMASALRDSIKNEKCVAFIQIGGLDRVFCCAPHSTPAGFISSVCPLQKARGVPGRATMFLYN